MGDARAQSRSGLRFRQWLMVGGLALGFTALPVTITPDLAAIDWQTAFGKNDGGRGGGGGGSGDRGGGQGSGKGNGHGGGHAGGHGTEGVRGHAHAHGRGGGHGPQSDYGSFDEFKDAMQSGKAFGLERRDERVEKAKQRYDGALSNGRRNGHEDATGFGVGAMAHRFSPEETSALIGRGWKGPQARVEGFRNHGERVRTMVELAKRLGYGAHVGALQANFGTPQENGIRELETELAEARSSLEAAPDDAALQARVAELEAALDQAVASAKPGLGPDGAWATADLDVNQDGVVDRRDLEALGTSQEDAAAAAPADPAA